MCSLLVANFFYVCQMHGKHTILCPVDILIVHAIEIFANVHPRTGHEGP